MNNKPTMKTKFIIMFAFACVATVTQAQEHPIVTANATTRFAVTGMSCDGCARGITFELNRTPGVAAADVTFRNKLAVMAYDTNRV